MGESVIRLECELPASPEAAREARLALSELAGQVSTRHYDDLRLLVTELVTNSLRHARLAAGDAIHLGVQLWPKTVRVEVSDPGTGFEAPPGPKDRLGGGGWGLYLLGRIADRWGVNGIPSTCVWFEMDIENP